MWGPDAEASGGLQQDPEAPSLYQAPGRGRSEPGHRRER